MGRHISHACAVFTATREKNAPAQEAQGRITSIELLGVSGRSFLSYSIGSGDDDANRFGVKVYRDGVPVDLTGVSCAGYFYKADGTMRLKAYKQWVAEGKPLKLTW